MPDTYDRIKEGLEEALSIANGEQPAASITVDGHTYVPKAELDEALRRYDERNRTAQYRAVSNGLKLERIAELESELAGCKIALEQAWESNRERQAELDDLKHDINSYIGINGDLHAEIDQLKNTLSAIATTDADHPGGGDYSRGWMHGRWSLKKMALRALGEEIG